jgi:hypothetical protein
MLLSGCASGTVEAPQRAGSAPGAAAFADITRVAGIDFVHDNGVYGAKLFPERMGSGVAMFDADGDGRLDLFFVNGAPLPGDPHPNPHPRPSRLYLNRGDGAFVDRTAGSGLKRIEYGMGVAVGDVDNDGAEDLYVTRLGGGALYRNDGHGVFTDITRRSGVGTSGFCTSAAFLDCDADGLLDLYVCRYVPWEGLKDQRPCLDPLGKREYCGVQVYGSKEHRLFRNLGGLRFQDVTRSAGIAGKLGRGLAVVCGDYDQDGDTDILVANDETPNFLWQNDGHGRFAERALVANFAYNEEGVATAGMGLDLADADGDGSFDVIESDFQNARKTLYVNDGHGFFNPNEQNKGLGDMPLQRLGFGIGFVDCDLNGHPDVFIANGHVREEGDPTDPNGPLAQTAQLFRNLGGGRYADESSRLGAYSRTRYVGRGAAFGDLDNDGLPDIVACHNGAAPVLLRNTLPRQSHWLGLKCVGTKSNRSGLGVVVRLEVGKSVRIDETRAASSYLSSSDPRLLFGLGREGRVRRVTLRWPSGAVQQIDDPPVDRYLTVVEGQPVATGGRQD